MNASFFFVVFLSVTRCLCLLTVLSNLGRRSSSIPVYMHRAEKYTADCRLAWKQASKFGIFTGKRRRKKNIKKLISQGKVAECKVHRKKKAETARKLSERNAISFEVYNNRKEENKARANKTKEMFYRLDAMYSVQWIERVRVECTLFTNEAWNIWK